MSKKSFRFQSGLDLVEYALIFPILFLVLMGIFDLGRVVYYYSALTNAAREGARRAVIDPDNLAAIRNDVCQLSVGLDLGCPTPSAETLDVTLIGSDYVQVSLSYKFAPVTPVIGVFLDLDENNQITVSTRSRMRIEG
jgi:Flp pilus assembly protein TadG